MNPVIKAQNKKYSDEQALGALSESDLFEVYSIYSILVGHQGFDVDPSHAHLRGNEFGLDGVAIIVQGRLVQDLDAAKNLLDDLKNPEIEFQFFQSKTGTSFDYGEIGKFLDGIEGFFTGDLEGESDQLDELIAVKDYVYEKGDYLKNPTLSAFFVTTGNYQAPKLTRNLLAQRTDRLSKMNIFDNENLKIEMVGAEKLQEYYRSATRSAEVKIYFPKQVSMPKIDSIDEAYIGYIAADELVKMVDNIDENGESQGINRFIFFDNVRDYDEKSPLNRAISETVESGEGTNFVYRNNGVTVIAKSIRRTGDDFNVEDYQIVNGCQTSNILFKNRENLDQIDIPFRLIGSRDEEFISSIIIGTNSQNSIKQEQFLALLPFMKNLEEYASTVEDDEKIFLERRDNQYQRETVEKARIIQLPVLLKSVAAVLIGQPNRSARDYKKIAKEYEKVLFQESDDVEIYHATCFMYYRLEFLWRNQRIDSSLKIFRFFILWAIGQQFMEKGNIINLAKQKERAQLAKEVITFCTDEEKLIKFVKKVGKLLAKEVKKLSPDNREKLRDAIRSDTFFEGFKTEIES